MANTANPIFDRGEAPALTGFLFDLDGVLTPTVELHKRAWRDTFNRFFEVTHRPPFRLEEYFQSLDGRSRFDGVDALLTARGIDLPWGTDSDTLLTTVCGIGNAKNQRFQTLLARDGIAPYPGSLRFLDALRGTDCRLAVVSSSRNARDVLTAAGIIDRFDVIVDGRVAEEHRLAGKPDPATYRYAAEQLGVAADRAVVFEDALSGVAAGHAGHFAEVIGVDRGSGADALGQAGASHVVTDLADLLPTEESPA